MVVRFSAVRAAVLSLLLLAAPAFALPPPDEAWIELRSPHFTLFSNTSEWATRRIALDLEQLRSALSQLNPQLQLTSPVPTWIHVFRDTSSFQPYKPLYQGRPLSLEGYFLSHPYGNYVGINADPRGKPTQILYHEYLHDVLRHNFPDIPLWFNEGLAEYYSTFDVAGSNARLGLPVPEHVFWLGRNALIPLRELVSMGTESRDYNEGKRRGVFYAQSWALVHYLLSAPDRREQTARYLQDLFRGMPGEEAFQRAFGDLTLLERDLRGYVQRRVFDTQRLPIQKDREIATEVRPLKRSDLLVRLGDLLLQLGSDRLPAGEEHFRAALAVDPGQGAAMAGLGRIAAASGRLADAQTHYLKATQLTPDDFFLHYLLGLSLITPEPAQQTLPQARAAFQRSVELRPDFAEGWGRLAQTLGHMDPQPPEALHVFETAWRLLPQRIDFAFNLALAYAERGAEENAQVLIDKVLALRRPDLAEKAREALVLGAWRKIEDDLIKTGKLAEALPALEALLPRVQSLERRAALQKRIEEIYGVADYNSFADRYNLAIDYLNAGRDTEAVALLEELAARTLNPGQAEEARKLLERVKAGPRGKG